MNPNPVSVAHRTMLSMSDEKTCPTHGLPIHLVERPDPRLSRSTGTSLEWRCEGGVSGHFIPASRIA